MGLPVVISPYLYELFHPSYNWFLGPLVVGRNSPHPSTKHQPRVGWQSCMQFCQQMPQDNLEVETWRCA